ncbi:MAG: VCBS repeat-containing protein, partial [Bacteroidetes bacterium]|nr:VCBS repeat-containing protein [Bacteroidota bacterium]
MFRNKSFLILLIAGWVLLPSCNDADQSREELSAVDQNNTTYLFTLLTAESTGIHFINNIEEDENRNIYSHEYMYNGGGVAVGDLNNDGLADIYFTGNMVPNKLYLNKGNMVFEDVTAIAEIAVEGSWCSGVSFIDINTDGLLDIYVCRAFYHDENLRHNLLFINQGDMKFVESGASYGVDDPGYSTQATWLDYDKDGDIDLFVGNYPSKLIKNLERAIYMRDNPDNKESDHLYRNNGDGTFTNVTSQAGLLNYGFALGIVSGDLNNDGWTDIYVANDYEEADHLYMNNG